MRAQKLIIAVSLLVICSCDQQAKSSVAISKEQATMVSSSSDDKQGKESDVPSGMVLGKPQEYRPSDKREQNMVSQINSYIRAILVADTKNLRYYMFEDAFDYYRKYYPEVSEAELNEAFFAFARQAAERKREYQKHQIEIGMVVEKINRKVEHKGALLYVFTLTGYMTGIVKSTGKEKSFYTPGSETLAISLDGGRTWKFLDIMEETPNILRMRFPGSVVDRVMGY